MYETKSQVSVSERIVASRVDMLIAVYDAAIEATQSAEELLRENNEGEASVATARALGFVGLIESGLDLDQGEIPKRIKDLCGFIEQSLLSRKPDSVAAAARVLRNLRDGFQGIRSQARTLEHGGSIPRICAESIDTVV